MMVFFVRMISFLLFDIIILFLLRIEGGMWILVFVFFFSLFIRVLFGL